MFSRHAPPIVIYHDRYDYRHYRQPDCYRYDKNLVQRTECRRCIFNRDAIPIIKEIDRVNQVGCAFVLKLEIIFFLLLVQVPNNFRAKRPRRFQIVILADLVFFGVRNDYAVLADNHLHIGFARRHGLCNHLLNWIHLHVDSNHAVAVAQGLAQCQRSLACLEVVIRLHSDWTHSTFPNLIVPGARFHVVAVRRLPIRPAEHFAIYQAEQARLILREDVFNSRRLIDQKILNLVIGGGGANHLVKRVGGKLNRIYIFGNVFVNVVGGLPSGYSAVVYDIFIFLLVNYVVVANDRADDKNNYDGAGNHRLQDEFLTALPYYEHGKNHQRDCDDKL